MNTEIELFPEEALTQDLTEGYVSVSFVLSIFPDGSFLQGLLKDRIMQEIHNNGFNKLTITD